MSPSKDKTGVHGCSSYLQCSYSGEAACANACRFWPNRGVEFGWFVLSTVSNLNLKKPKSLPSPVLMASGVKVKAYFCYFTR